MIHHTRRTDIGVLSWEVLDEQWEVCSPALIDRGHEIEGGRNLLARIDYDEALAYAALVGGQLISSEQLDLLREVAFVQLAPYLGTPRAENGIEHSEAHDRDVWRQLDAAGWAPGKGPVMGAGKHWVAGAPAGKSRLKGWDKDGAGPGKAYWQPDAVAHNRKHFDDGTTTLIVRPRRPGTVRSIFEAAKRAIGGVTNLARAAYQSALGAEYAKEQPVMRPTIRLGSTGQHVTAWQRILGLTGLNVDGVFGEGTKFKTEQWQAARGLVADGVVGARSWEAAGEIAASPVRKDGSDPQSPACRAALRDANKAWPLRSKRSDGIMGDAKHQARKSDHNDGNAVDITHDPASGCDGDVLSRLAIQDPRVTYVIWESQIFNRARAAEGWRKYTGSNPHTHHVHISVRADARDDASPWPWAA